MRPPVLLVHDEARGAALVDRVRGLAPYFLCTVAYTHSVQVPGISAAGATPESRELTAAADAEMLCCGRALCLQGVPSNPSGAPGPVIITRASLQHADIPFGILDAGTRVAPGVPAMTVPSRAPAQAASTGRALPHARALFEEGYRLGESLADRGDYLLLAESVPGGTTTALAVLWGLGYDAAYRVSSSSPHNPHDLKIEHARQGLEAAGLLDSPEGDPFRVLEAVGDPMQAVVAGMALRALEKVPVFLAGGTQMLAVLAFMKALADMRALEVPWSRCLVATTNWVSEDRKADVRGLARAIAVSPVVSSNLDFSRSVHPEMRLYEEGYVKEGVGAGGAAVAAMLKTGITPDALTGRIERVFTEVVQGQPVDPLGEDAAPYRP